MTERRLLYILPSHSHFDYVWACVDSYFRAASSEDALLLIDDASPDWPQEEVSRRTAHNPRLLALHFIKNGGLTRSWNAGLETSRELGFAYTVCGNSDVLFPLGWEQRLLHHLDEGFYSLAGPVSNAPGDTANGLQDVSRYAPNYRLSDSQEDIDATGSYLQAYHPDAIPTRAINGFLMAARTSTWWQGAFDYRHVFKPRVDRMPSGRRNPTPFMTGNEDELQQRWRALGLHSCVVPGSFCFHYRAVSRGDRYRKGQWMRRTA